MQAIPRLNLDVTLIILSYLEQPALARFSTVCRLYHPHALRRLLSSEIGLYTPEQLASFCDCVLADAATRGPWVISLAMDWWAFTYVWSEFPEEEDIPLKDEATVIADISSVSMLANVLRHCTGLRYLEVPVLGKLLDADPQIGISITSLPALSALHIVALDRPRPVEQLLHNLQVQLTSLNVEYIASSRIPPTPPLPFPLPNPATVPCLVGVENLSVFNILFPISSQPCTPWSSVRKLQLNKSDVHIGHIAMMFPGIEEFIVGWEVGISREDDEAVLWPELVFLKICWESMPFVDMEGCGCLVHRLEVSEGGHVLSDTEAMDHLLDLVEDVQPLILSVYPIDTTAGYQLGTTSLRCFDLMLNVPLIPNEPDVIVREAS